MLGTITKPIRIVAMGMDKHACNMYALLFSKHTNGQYTLADINQAEACIFDLDSYGAQKLWNDFRREYPELPTIVLSLREKNLDGTRFVKKPINVKDFLTTLTKVKQQIEDQGRSNSSFNQKTNGAAAPQTTINQPKSSPTKQTKINQAGHLIGNRQIYSNLHANKVECGYLPDIDPHKTEQLEKIYYDPSQHFQALFENALKQAKEKKACVLLEGFIGKVIINPMQNQVLCTSTEDALHSLMLLPMKKDVIKMRFFDCIELSYHIQSNVLPFHYNYLDQFRWKMAIWASHGHLPQGTPLETPIILLHWPNLTRVLLTPHALQITALWIERPFSLLETAKRLGIEQRYVFTFYSAVYAIGLAFPERRGKPRDNDDRYSTNPDSIFNANKEKRSLFKRILSRLSFSN